MAWTYPPKASSVVLGALLISGVYWAELIERRVIMHWGVASTARVDGLWPSNAPRNISSTIVTLYLLPDERRGIPMQAKVAYNLPQNALTVGQRVPVHFLKERLNFVVLDDDFGYAKERISLWLFLMAGFLIAPLARKQHLKTGRDLLRTAWRTHN